MTRVVRGFRQRRRAFPIGLLAGLVCAAVWLVAVGTSAEAQGVSGYTEVTGAAVTVPGFTSATGSATCPAGDVVLSGGYTLVGGNMVIDTSAPLGANGAISSTTWTVTGFDNGDGQGSLHALRDLRRLEHRGLFGGEQGAERERRQLRPAHRDLPGGQRDHRGRVRGGQHDACDQRV